MNTEHKAGLLWRFLQSTIISTILLALFTALVCWFGGWRTMLAYGNGLVYAGGTLLFICSLMFIGGQSRTYHYQGSKHGFSPIPIDDREALNFENSKQRRVDISDAVHTTVTLVFPAVLCIIIGLILVDIVD